MIIWMRNLGRIRTVISMDTTSGIYFGAAYLVSLFPFMRDKRIYKREVSYTDLELFPYLNALKEPIVGD
jgi:hypothetical protein